MVNVCSIDGVVIVAIYSDMGQTNGQEIVTKTWDYIMYYTCEFPGL